MNVTNQVRTEFEKVPELLQLIQTDLVLNQTPGGKESCIAVYQYGGHPASFKYMVINGENNGEAAKSHQNCL